MAFTEKQKRVIEEFIAVNRNTPEKIVDFLSLSKPEQLNELKAFAAGIGLKYTKLQANLDDQKARVTAKQLVFDEVANG